MKKKYTKIGTALILMLLLFIIYAAFIEPKQLKWEHITIPIPQKHTSIQSLKIIQFSDTHVKNEKEQKQLKKIVEQINQAKADFVIFTGDLIDNPNQFMYEDVLVPTKRSMVNWQFLEIMTMAETERVCIRILWKIAIFNC